MSAAVYALPRFCQCDVVVIRIKTELDTDCRDHTADSRSNRSLVAWRKTNKSYK